MHKRNCGFPNSSQHYRAPLNALLILALGIFSGSADWKQFRGPQGLGISDAKGLPTEWNHETNVLWKTPLPGAGTSSPVTIGEKLFLTTYSGFNVPGEENGAMDQLQLGVVCLDKRTGDILWNTTTKPKLPEQERIRENHGYASNTPVVDQNQLYVFFGKSGVLAYDHSGEVQWQAEVGSGLSGWGSGASLVLHKNLLIVNASVESQCLIALDKTTGREVWRTPEINEAWNTPALVPLPNGQTELVISMPKKMIGLDPESGEELWRCQHDIRWYIAPSMVFDKGIIWCLGGRSGTASVAVRAGGRGDVTETHKLWSTNKGSNVTSPVYHDGHLYWMHENIGMAYCADAMTGELVYEERINRAGQIYGSCLLADGRLHYISRRGITYVLPAEPHFEVLSTNSLRDGSQFNATPIADDNRIYVRSDTFLYCIGR